MYGMVNRAIEDLVCEKFGEEAWEQIKAMAGVDVDLFVRNETYPDDVTYRLVGAASRVLGVNAGVVLETFGEHWIVSTARDGYGELLDAAGKTLGEFLMNLPNFHSRIVLIFPKLNPPKFVCTEVEEESLRLHYHSHRPGLAPMVVGMMRGLGKMFETDVVTDMVADRAAGAEHDEFIVRWGSAARARTQHLAAEAAAA
ncbi:MAG: heme binding protein [Gemmatimonadetes bacterium]|nr:heme binding protein [Gemmatimonadota bacterium]